MHALSLLTLLTLFLLLIIISNQILFSPRVSRLSQGRNKCDERQTHAIMLQRNCLETIGEPAEQIIESLRAGNLEPALAIARDYLLKCNPNDLDFDQECCTMSSAIQKECKEIARLI